MNSVRLGLLPSRCDILLITKVQSAQTGQMDGDGTPADLLTGQPCRLDVNKYARDVTQTAEYEKATHVLVTNLFPFPLNTKLHQVRVDGVIYRLTDDAPVYGRMNTPHHYELGVLRVS